MKVREGTEVSEGTRLYAEAPAPSGRPAGNARRRRLGSVMFFTAYIPS